MLEVRVVGDEISVIFNYGFQEIFGTYSIIGTLAKELSPKGIDYNNKEISFVFFEPDSNWYRKNQGPHLELMCSHFPRLLISEVLYLIEHGVKISIKTITDNPST